MSMSGKLDALIFFYLPREELRREWGLKIGWGECVLHRECRQILYVYILVVVFLKNKCVNTLFSLINISYLNSFAKLWK